jgi:hypothetical protein
LPLSESIPHPEYFLKNRSRVYPVVSREATGYFFAGKWEAFFGDVKTSSRAPNLRYHIVVKIDIVCAHESSTLLKDTHSDSQGSFLS